jgi:cytochrome c553
MNLKKELRVAYILAAVLLIVGVASYAAFSARAPEKDPVRLMFQTDAGKVLFQHQLHTQPSGYGASCNDCHHHPKDDEAALRACGDCHGKDEKMTEATLETCIKCHEADEVKDTQMVKRADAFHTQCIECHKDFEKGPVECSACHIM